LFVEPGADLRGRLRLVQNDDETLFTGEGELLRLLRLAIETPHAGPFSNSATGTEPASDASARRS
jgi:hypothetical protein